MKLAIMLLCHKNMLQIVKLISVLNHPDVKIFIHMDKKVKDLSILSNINNVVLLPPNYRVDVRWGEYSVAQAMINLIRFAKKTDDYDYYWFCSGQDYPIRDIETILTYLDNNKGKNFIHFYDFLNYKVGNENNYDKRNIIYYPQWMMRRNFVIRCMKRIYINVTGGYNYTWRMFRRRNKFSKIKSYFGSQWSCINRDLLNWIVDYIDKNEWFLTNLENSLVPDECIIQTLVMISPYRNSIEDYLHYIVFDKGKSSPNILTIKDIDNLRKSSALMARKFDVYKDEKILKLLPIR